MTLFEMIVADGADGAEACGDFWREEWQVLWAFFWSQVAIAALLHWVKVREPNFEPDDVELYWL